LIFQRTIKASVTVTGVGLHSGCRVKLTLRPANHDQGIIFVRSDLPDTPKLRCHPFLINDTRLSSTLVDDNGVRVATVEHLMSAFACMGIDNIIVELSAPEIPIMDGSSNSFLYLLNQAEVIEQAERKKYIKILQAVKVVESDVWVSLEPYEGYKVKISLNYDHPLFKKEMSSFEVDFAKHSYISEISRARTFAFMYEIENIRRNGLGLGGNLNNAIVINDDDTVLNEGGLRFKDEFVRHKILDAIGDLHVAGHPIIGSFEGYKSGHAINNKLLRKLFNNPDCWEFVTFENEEQVPSSFHAA
jgi:UDP-3-O-[3-hydroxymyristoyl] N-acetylglucosamine deacetylase